MEHTTRDWKKEFEHDFRNKKFTNTSQEENTKEAIEYFWSFIESIEK